MTDFPEHYQQWDEAEDDGTWRLQLDPVTRANLEATEAAHEKTLDVIRQGRKEFRGKVTVGEVSRLLNTIIEQAYRRLEAEGDVVDFPEYYQQWDEAEDDDESYKHRFTPEELRVYEAAKRKLAYAEALRDNAELSAELDRIIGEAHARLTTRKRPAVTPAGNTTKRPHHSQLHFIG